MQNDFLTEKLPPYIFAAIYQLKKQAALNNIDVIDFGMGNPDSPPPQHIIDKLSDLVKDKKLYGYSVTGGIEELKQAICQYYQRNFNVSLDYKSESLVTIGSKEGIASLATAISNNEDHIIVPSPSYPIHTFAFTIAKTNIKHIEAIEPQDFLIKFKKYVESSSKKPKAVIVSYPCNPTAKTVNIDFYQELVDFCLYHQIYIISDIAYCEIYFDKKDKPNSILEIKNAKNIAIEFSSVSKSYSMAGSRIGFAVGNPKLISALYKIKSYLDYGSFTPLQMVACDALSSKSDDYLNEIRKKYDERGNFLIKEFANRLNWHIEKPKASMFLWSKIPNFAQHLSSFEFCKKLIEEAGVAISPGSSFGSNGEGFVRFSLIHDYDKIIKAAKNISNIISTF
jgi:alanine-synthesizing transaminase